MRQTGGLDHRRGVSHRAGLDILNRGRAPSEGSEEGLPPLPAAAGPSCPLACGRITLTSASAVTSLSCLLASLPLLCLTRTPVFRFNLCPYKDHIPKHGPMLRLQAGMNLEALFHPGAPRGGEGGVQEGTHSLGWRMGTRPRAGDCRGTSQVQPTLGKSSPAGPVTGRRDGTPGLRPPAWAQVFLPTETRSGHCFWLT